MLKGSVEGGKNQVERKERVIAVIKYQEMPLDKSKIEQAGAWMMSVPYILIGKNVSDEKLWYNLHIQFGLEPLGLWNR